MNKNTINIGVPSKGRLKKDTLNIFKKKKLRIYSERGERDLFGYIKKSSVKIIYLHARECIEQLSLGNIDITVVLEVPRLQKLILQMRENISSLTSLNIDRISIKSSTSQGVGLIGNNQAIACYSSILIKK